MLRVGIDVGGTFTDLFAWDDQIKGKGSVRTAKVLSTPENNVVGFMGALSKAGIDPKEIDMIVHGTTVGTNALIERSYPEPALITTEGFRDTLEIKRQIRENLYDPYQVKPKPLISRNMRFTVKEKLSSDGETIIPISREEAVKIAHEIKERGIKNIAIAFINSYVSGKHEREMRDIILEVIPDAQIAISSETRPKIRELGRFVTTAIRAALFPVVGDYISRLEETLKEAGCKAPLFIVKSNGGMMRSNTAKLRPEELIESGPAGGITAGKLLYNLLGEKNMIITDVGGTSFEASLMENGEGLVTDEYELEWEMPIITPMLDIRSIGSGGGSIAWIDDGGSLRVGPKSAGAFPGPACYGRGGKQPTVTDANLVLGRLNPTLSGKMELDYEAAVEAIKTIAEPLGLSVIECAEGIIDIACENMASAIRMVSTDRGRDPREQTYVAFGGAGGLHAYRVAESAGINHIIVPPFAGVDCAVGAATMDVRHDLEKTHYKPTREVDTKELTKLFEELEEECKQMLKNDGVAEENMNFERTALMRYIGQSYEVATEIPDGEITNETIAKIEDSFHQAHKQEYGVYNESFPIAFVTLRVSGNGATSQIKGDVFEIVYGESDDSSQNIKTREIYFNNTKYEVDILQHNQLELNKKYSGPVIVEQLDSVVVVPPNAKLKKDKYGFTHINLIQNNESTLINKEKETVLK